MSVPLREHTKAPLEYMGLQDSSRVPLCNLVEQLYPQIIGGMRGTYGLEKLAPPDQASSTQLVLPWTGHFFRHGIFRLHDVTRKVACRSQGLPSPVGGSVSKRAYSILPNATPVAPV